MTATVKYSQINITVISLHVRWRGEVFACHMASGKKKNNNNSPKFTL